MLTNIGTGIMPAEGLTDMDRRTALQLALTTGAGALGSAFATRETLAAGAGGLLDGPLAGGVYYTEAHPGRWASKARDHLPRVTHEVGWIKVATPHPMTQFRHYIVKHVLLDSDYRYIDEHLFDPLKDTPVSRYKSTRLKGTVYALSMCNKHDLWIATLTL